MGLLYVKQHVWWIQYVPALVRDDDLDEWELGQLLTVGEELTRRVSLGLDPGQPPDLDVPSGSGIATDARYRASLKLKWIVGF